MRVALIVAVAFVAPFVGGIANSAEYDRGASDSEIILGQTIPYSGPVSAAAPTGFASTAYFDKINKAGGINGRKIKLISTDDAYSPPKAFEAVRRLVEGDGVLLIYGSLGTPTNAVAQKYLNSNKIPQLFINTGASRFSDPSSFPWTMSAMASYEAEARAMGEYVVKTVPDPKIAILSQNDDLGRDYVRGFKAGLGEKAKSLIVSELTFEITDPAITSQMVSSKASGANVFYFAGTQKYGAMQLRSRSELGWNPVSLVCSTASGLETVLRVAGLDKAEGLISAAYLKDPDDPRWAEDADVKAFLAWVKDNFPKGTPQDYVYGYISSYLISRVLEQAGSNLTRKNILEIATHLTNVQVPLLLPGVTASSTPTDYALVKKFQMMRFKNGRWSPLD